MWLHEIKEMKENGKKVRKKAAANNARRQYPHNSNGIMLFLKSNVDLSLQCGAPGRRPHRHEAGVGRR